MSEIDYGKLRSDFLEFLRSGEWDRQISVYYGQGVIKFLMDRGHTLDWPDVTPLKVVIHQLVVEGVLIPGVTNGASGNGWELPHCFVSPHGRKVLDNAEYEPHDPEGYLARLRKEVPGTDPVIEAYLVEALGCYRHRFHLASAVMLGAASEKAMLGLIATMKRGLKDQAFDKAIARARNIKEQHEALTKFLPDPKSLSGELAERLPQAVEFVFHTLRIARNDAGHPTGRFVQPGVVHGNLVLFPSYLRTLKDLDAHFA